MPYPEPGDAFFKTLQDQVISKTLGDKLPVAEKETKVFSLNLKWMSAAAVVLVAGITAFWGTNNNPDTQIAQQEPIVDSMYEVNTINQTVKTETAIVKKKQDSDESPVVVANTPHVNPHHSVAKLSDSQPKTDNKDFADRQNYVIDKAKKPEGEVEKILAAFTPDQIKDLDKNSEQDVYLDLYN